MDYSTYVATMQNLMVVQTGDANFTQILPTIITSAEERIWRDLDLISTIVTDTSASTAVGSNTVAINANFVVVQNVNISGSGLARTPLTPVNRAFIDTVYGNAAMTAAPVYFAMLTQSTLIVGPIPDAPYTVEVIGTQRPATMSSTNPNTFIGDNLPDLFIAASMIFASGYQQNFGSQADDPRMAASWDTQYQELLKAAGVEELRKKFQSQAWSPLFPTPAAPPRG